MVKAIHYKIEISPKTACGWYLEDRPKVKHSTKEGDVTCGRCLRSLEKWKKRRDRKGPAAVPPPHSSATFQCRLCYNRIVSTMKSTEDRTICKSCAKED